MHRMFLQGRSHQLLGGAVDTITRGVARKVRRARGVWGHAPQEILPYEKVSDAILGNIASLSYFYIN